MDMTCKCDVEFLAHKFLPFTFIPHNKLHRGSIVKSN